MAAALAPELPIWLGVNAAAALYLSADRRVAQRHGGRRPRPWHRRSFLAGLLTILVALAGPIDAAAATSLCAHMVQHLLLTMVAAPLLVLGAPLTLTLQVVPAGSRRRLLSILHSAPARTISNPVTAWVLFMGALWATHVTGLYDAALRNTWIHAAEHLVYFMTAILFWMPVAGVDPSSSRLSHPARILYLFLAMPAMTFLGLAIYSASGVLYPTYVAIEGHARALADQHLAGALMWNVGLLLLLPALALVLFDWMRADERTARRLDERFLKVEPR